MHTSIPQNEIDRFLDSGDYDVLFSKFPGGHLLARAKHGHDALASALLDQVRLRELGAVNKASMVSFDIPKDTREFARNRVEPMVRGLFPASEREAVLELLQESLVFVTAKSVDSIVQSESLTTAWEVANLYLRSIGASPTSDKSPNIVGLSADEKCYVSMQYFKESDLFADYVVHEAAHIFHNVKRRLIGLKGTRRCEWLLPIKFQKRETFAYACEAYSRFSTLKKMVAERSSLLNEYQLDRTIPDDRVDTDELLSILSEAVARRNGWKVILGRCAA